jgi:DNA-binding response OmpR family regulator
MNDGRLRVLAVDDQPELFDGLRELLEEEHIDLVVHTSLITLPFVLREIDPDVILLDVHMPLTGTSLLRCEVRDRLPTNAPIVLFSGSDPRELSKLTEEHGANGFLSKVAEPAEIVRHLRAWGSVRSALARKERKLPCLN